MKKVLMIVSSALALAACGTSKVPAIDTGNFDLSVSPKEDFYHYVNGGWQQKNPLKPEYARFGAFDVLAENNRVRLNDLFQSMSQMKTVPGSVEQKIVDLYKMALDSTVRNEAGALAKVLNIIGAHGFNMTNLRSRPMKKGLWNHFFYAELEGSAHSGSGRELLTQLNTVCSQLKLVGTYKRM